MMKLLAKVALVAGGGQGIGEGIARCLAEEGANVAISDIKADTANKVAGSLGEMGRKALAIQADLTGDEGVDKTVRETIDFFGRIDVLVSNVGGISEETSELMQQYVLSGADPMLPPYMRYNSELWDRFYALNLKSHALLGNAVTPHLIAQGSGSIINISSVAGRLPDPGNIAYAACKAGDISLTWSIARALAPFGIRVNCVCPGIIYTPLWERAAGLILTFVRSALSAGQALPPPLDQARASDLEEMSVRDFWLEYIAKPAIPMGRGQTVEDIGRAVVFLASDDAQNITGQVLHVDGGMVMR